MSAALMIRRRAAATLLLAAGIGLSCLSGCTLRITSASMKTPDTTNTSASSGSSPKSVAPAIVLANHWSQGMVNVRVFTDPDTGCQYLVFESNNNGGVSVTPRQGVNHGSVCSKPKS